MNWMTSAKKRAKKRQVAAVYEGDMIRAGHHKPNKLAKYNKPWNPNDLLGKENGNTYIIDLS